MTEDIDVDECEFGGIKLRREGNRLRVDMPGFNANESIIAYDRLRGILEEGFDKGFRGVHLNIICCFDHDKSSE